ncbi:VOC family protein [Microbacterium sp. ARD31]|uniref:VOC family protein n=1 Tax=Microbacterium sp. ARD31 TaxID=2962576 RepID=UPI002881C02F|nr:VOC family protein [Microbacterium sp. ARD31]MDT0183945.1 VOC family protein [Microbacterium sp. ARD31]
METPYPTPADTPVRVSKLGYVEFQTPDVDRLTNYYTKVLDFVAVEQDQSEAYLTTSFDHHAVVLKKAADSKARTVVGYEIFEELSDAQRRLTAAGYSVERRSDIAPSTPDVLVLAEPLTGSTIHLYDAQSTSGVEGYTPIRPSKLGHVASFVPDLGPVQDFYQGLLGFRWSDMIGDFFVFLRCNSDHHAANFMASKKFEGMHHIAYEMRDLNHLQTMLDHLAKNDFRLHWGPGRHGAGHNLFTYHKDPDGNNIELFTQLDVITDEAKGYFEPRPWHEDYPQYPKTWEVDLVAVNAWGPIEHSMIEH